MKNSAATALDFIFSFVRFAADDGEPVDYSFRQFMADVRDGKWRDPVEKVRAAYQAAEEKTRAAGLSEAEILKAAKEAAKPFKMSLPGGAISGRFKHRNAKELIAPTGYLCVDLDQLENVDGTRDLIVADPHTLACKVSPSGTGLKVFFRIDPARPHHESYLAAEAYVRGQFGLEIDTACKDVSRLCFVSYDPDAFIADDAEVLPYPKATEEVDAPVAVTSHIRRNFPIGLISPGDDYNARGDWDVLLKKHRWTEAQEPYWTRPDKKDGISASWDVVPGCFHVFTSSAPPLKPANYKPFALFAILECDGDFQKASDTLYDLEYGTRRKPKPILPEPDQQAHLDAENEASATANNHEGNGETSEEQMVRITKEHHARVMSDSPLAPIKPPETPVKQSKFKPYTLWKPGQFLAHVTDPNDCVLGLGYLELGQWTSFIGIGGLGKTRLALWLCLCQIARRPWCDIPTNGKPLKWVILSTENGIRRWKSDLEKMRLFFTPAEWLVIEEHLLIMAMTPDEDGDLNLGNPETIARLKATLMAVVPGAVIFDPFADMVDGDENKTVDLVHTLRILRNITQSCCPRAAVVIIHHARTGSANVAQASDNFNAGNFARGAKALYSKVRCEMQLSPADRDDPNRFVLSCGKANDCPKFAVRCVVFDPETFGYSIDPDFDLETWREDVAGKRKETPVSIADVVTAVRELAPYPGDETDTKKLIAKLEPSGVAARTIQGLVKLAVEAGYLRRGNKRWIIKLGAKPLPK